MVPSDASLVRLFESLWDDYAAITPAATRIRRLLEPDEGTLINDHVALRSFAHPALGIEALAAPLLARGYRLTGEYHFEAKGLDARSYSHAEARFPRVFISELRRDALEAAEWSSIDAQIETFCARIGDIDDEWRAWLHPRMWPRPTHETYARLLARSEYAGWTSAFGLRANHFTVDVRAHPSYDDLARLNAFLRAQGFRLNGDPDTPIQGDPRVGLEQSSIVAERVPFEFDGGETVEIPSCYYEFALRHPLEDGVLFDGFVTQSADKIFESTDSRHHTPTSEAPG